MTEVSHVDTAALAAALRARVVGEVRFDAGSRAAYSTDASSFRQVPITCGTRPPGALDPTGAPSRQTRPHPGTERH